MVQREKLNCNEASASPARNYGANIARRSSLTWLCLYIPAPLLLAANCAEKGMTFSLLAATWLFAAEANS